MPKYFWAALFALSVSLGVTFMDGPPFEEGPNAQRMNQMSEEAPNGPWGPGPL
ncbi:MAG: hypothetical protein V3T31_10050 [candidate division Zixibacteria bacterium]